MATATSRRTPQQQRSKAKVDAILMQPAGGDASLPTMKSITAAGITLICYGNCLGAETDPAVVKGVIQSDNTALGTGTGQVAADYIKTKLGGKANIAILNCDIASACKLRKAGFKAALQAAGVQANFVTDQEAYLADKATRVATDIMTAHPEINAFWASNDGDPTWAFEFKNAPTGAVIAVKQAGKSIPVFGTDISTQLAQFLLASDNIMQVTTGQDPVKTAEGAYQMAKNAIAGKANNPFQVELPGIVYNRSQTDNIKKFLGQ